MSGSLVLRDTVAGISGTTVKPLIAAGAHAAASLLVDVTAITGTWTITVRWVATSGNSINVAEITGITTTGLRRLTLTSDFNATRMAVPEPHEIVFTLTSGPGTLSAHFYEALGD